MSLSKINKRNRIKKRIRQHVLGSTSRPRLSVFRSNKEIYAQLVDDVSGNTLASASSRDKDVKNDKIKITKLAQGLPVGGEIENLDDGTLFSAFKNRANLNSNSD